MMEDEMEENLCFHIINSPGSADSSDADKKHIGPILKLSYIKNEDGSDQQCQYDPNMVIKKEKTDKEQGTSHLLTCNPLDEVAAIKEESDDNSSVDESIVLTKIKKRNQTCSAIKQEIFEAGGDEPGSATVKQENFGKEIGDSDDFAAWSESDAASCDDPNDLDYEFDASESETDIAVPDEPEPLKDVKLKVQQEEPKLIEITDKNQKNIKQPFQCATCNSKFQTLSALRSHMKSCKRRAKGCKSQSVKCGICNAVVSHASNLKRHIRLHSEEPYEKPYKCPHCDKGFGSRQHLNSHIYTHTGERPFKCKHCGRGFTQRSHVREHEDTHLDKAEREQKRKHLKSRRKSLPCEECGKIFTGPKDLKIHIRTHTGERPYKCDLCDKAFTMRQHLKGHIMWHKGEKNFECDVCHEKFYRRYRLTEHMRKHSGEKPFQCKVCRKKFRISGSFRSHIKLCKKIIL